MILTPKCGVFCSLVESLEFSSFLRWSTAQGTDCQILPHMESRNIRAGETNSPMASPNYKHSTGTMI